MYKFMKSFILIMVLYNFIYAGSTVSAFIIPADRRIDWNPGIPGGIPNRTTIYANVKNPPYNAAGDGIADDTTAIQNAINDCPEGQVVYMPEGTYKTISGLVIRKGIVLRGASPSKTKIKNYGSPDNILYITGGSASSIETSLTTNAIKGNTTILVMDVSPFSVNDYVLIDELNDGVNVIRGDCGWCGRDNGNRAKGQIVKITAIEGNSVSFTPELYLSYSTSQEAEMFLVSNNVVEYAGIEDLYVERINNSGQNNIRLYNASYCWVKNVESYMTVERHIQLCKCYRCEVRDSYIHHSHVYASSYGYGISLFRQSTACLIENNIIYYTINGVQMEGGPCGCVISYNYMKDQFRTGVNWLAKGIGTHGAYPHMNLVEGNICGQLCYDYVHGNAGYMTNFRNHITRQSSSVIDQRYGLWVSRVAYSNNYMTFIGNVFGLPDQSYTNYEDDGTKNSSQSYIYVWGYSSGGDSTSDDPKPKATAFRHGNYDYYNQATIWNPNIVDYSIPNSFYLTSKPVFFEDKPWPCIGPDLNQMVYILPAKKRFENIMSIETNPSIQAPSNLRIEKIQK